MKAATSRISRRGSLDPAAPASRIDSPAPGSTLPVGVATTIAGTALDFGGGSVARVEISLDSGRTWLRAQGTDRWKFVWTPATAGAFNVLSRAIDDSGNAEQPLSSLSVMTTETFGARVKLSAKSTVAPPPPGGGCGRYGCSDSAVADFQAGSSGDTCAAFAHCHNELILKPAMAVDFAAMPGDWMKVEPPLGLGSATINNGQVVVENAYAYSFALYSQPRGIKFGATFTGPNQRAGAGITFDGASWARFSTDATGTKLFAQSQNGLETPASTEVTIANAIGQPHVFRIEWTNASISYFVDGVSVGPPHSTPIGNDMRPVVRDDTADGKALSVNWIRLSPYATSGTFHSRIFDRGSEVLWTTTRSKRVVPAGTTIQLCARVGNTAVPDATWSAFKCQADLSAPTSIAVRGRYAQYRATLTGTPSATPELLAVQQDLNPCEGQDCSDNVACTSDPCTNVPNPACAGVDPNDPILCPEPFLAECGQHQPGPCAGSTFCDPLVCDEFQGCMPGPDACPLVIGQCIQVTCSGDACVQTPINAACNDNNPCTDDSCNPVNGACVFTNDNTNTCSDANACTQTDSCQAGACVGSNPKTCNDSKACTDDSCNPSNGACVFTNDNTNTCSDSNACTQTDSCQAGACVGSNPKTCNDNKACTDDTCNPSTGACAFTNDNTNTCNDGNACTQTDTCYAGACTGSSPIICTASDQCHSAGACSPATGVCSNPLRYNGASCSDSNASTVNDACQNGVCSGTPTSGTKQKLTGSGCVQTPRGTKAQFSLNVKKKKNGDVQGRFSYYEKKNGGGGINISGRINTFVRTGTNTATLTGSCGGSCQFTVDIVDNGDSGKNDWIRVRITGNGSKNEDTGLKKLCGGNIQFHPGHPSGGHHNDHDDEHDGHCDDDDRDDH